jgi:hypothetical protein
MSLTKQYEITLPITLTKQLSASIAFNIDDVNVYSVKVNITDGATTPAPLDLTPYTVEFILDGTPMAGVSITDAANGVVTVDFSDLSGYTANQLKQAVLRLTEATVVKNYSGFNFSCYKLP